MAALGLGGYASGSEEDEDMRRQSANGGALPDQDGKPHLLATYGSHAAMDSDEEGMALPGDEQQPAQQLDATPSRSMAPDQQQQGLSPGPGLRSPSPFNLDANEAEADMADARSTQGLPVQEQQEDASTASPLMCLPPELREPLPTQASQHLQEKVDRFLAASRKGHTFTDTLRAKRDYRNPDFINKLVEHHSIQQYGTLLNPEVFNPDALPAEDRAEALMRAWERQQEVRARERQQRATEGAKVSIDFMRGGALAAAAAAAGAGMPASRSGGNLTALQAAAPGLAHMQALLGSRTLGR